MVAYDYNILISRKFWRPILAPSLIVKSNDVRFASLFLEREQRSGGQMLHRTELSQELPTQYEPRILIHCTIMSVLLREKKDKTET